MNLYRHAHALHCRYTTLECKNKTHKRDPAALEMVSRWSRSSTALKKGCVCRHELGLMPSTSRGLFQLTNCNAGAGGLALGWVAKR
eukprot:1139183-Pelagomonas_calceolata.AAC.4